MAALLPNEYELPEAYQVGDPVVVDRNRTLAGSYGAMAQQIKFIREREPYQAVARDRRSFWRQTKGYVMDLKNMALTAVKQRRSVVQLGGVPFPQPPELTATSNMLYQEYRVQPPEQA